MKPTFKLFNELVETDLSEEQLDEIFGKFFGKSPADAAKDRLALAGKLEVSKKKLEQLKKKKEDELKKRGDILATPNKFNRKDTSLSHSGGKVAVRDWTSKSVTESRDDTVSLHKVDDRWCIVMTGVGDHVKNKRPLSVRIRDELDRQRIPWDDDSDDLSLELIDPTPSQILSLKQYLKTLKDAHFKFNGEFYS